LKAIPLASDNRADSGERMAAAASGHQFVSSCAAVTSKVRWGVLGVARIATQKVIPAMLRAERTDVVAIASRDSERARRAAATLGIPRAYGSYEQLLSDPDIEAVYIPLPNHLHVEWTIRAAEAGKHVLCEKPIAMSAAEAERLLDVRDRTGVRIQEAFMVRTHPQWIASQEIVQSGRLGDVRALAGFFNYFNEDPANVRNIRDFGGGALYDIGCYLINTARFIFGREPQAVAALIEHDPRFGVDVVTSFLLDFAPGQTTALCSTQLVPSQRILIFGTRGRLEIEIPVNAPPDRACRMFVDDGSDLFGGGRQTIAFDVCDQYTIQADRFSQAVRCEASLAYPIEDSVQNMRVIDAVFRAALSGRWETV
jgi:predicted dehydrogenase